MMGSAIEIIILELKKHTDLEKLSIGWIMMSAVCLIAAFLYQRYLKHECSKENLKKPFSIQCQTAMNGESRLKIKDIRLHRVSRNCWYGRELRRKNIRIFLFSFEETGSDQFDPHYVKKTIQTVNERTHYPSINNVEHHVKWARVNLYAFAELPEEILEKAKESTVDDMESRDAESVLSFYVDLKKATAYIPRYCSVSLFNINKYYYCVKRFHKWLA